MSCAKLNGAGLSWAEGGKIVVVRMSTKVEKAYCGEWAGVCGCGGCGDVGMSTCTVCVCVSLLALACMYVVLLNRLWWQPEAFHLHTNVSGVKFEVSHAEGSNLTKAKPVTTTTNKITTKTETANNVSKHFNHNKPSGGRAYE